MNNERAERALKIAGFEGYKQHSLNTAHWYAGDYETCAHLFFYNDMIRYYSSFNGLMPIVERVNKLSRCDYEIIIDEESVYVQKYHEADENNSTCETVFSESYQEQDNNILIDCLQKAIIFYYEEIESNQ